MLDQTEAGRACGEGAARRPTALCLGPAGATMLLLLAACSSATREIVPAVAPAPTPECAIEWPDDPTAAPVVACRDGSRRTIRPGPALVIGDPALSQAVP